MTKCKINELDDAEHELLHMLAQIPVTRHWRNDSNTLSLINTVGKRLHQIGGTKAMHEVALRIAPKMLPSDPKWRRMTEQQRIIWRRHCAIIDSAWDGIGEGSDNGVWLA